MFQRFLCQTRAIHIASLLLVSGLLQVRGVPSTSSRPEVRTELGVLRGETVKTPSGRRVDAYIGVPYAKPPLGTRRFKPPEPPEPWNDVFEATEQPATCFQRRIPLAKHIPALVKFRTKTKSSEDCLKMNIWVSKEGEFREPTGLPVLVWLYGGGFSRGGVAVDAYDGRVIASEENVIVITANYRVASFGFLYLDHPEVPGNAGLHDQLAVLKWIQNHIRNFGGDPDRVTLIGQSAGSASVGYHLLSEKSSKMFKRAVMESGAPQAIWAYVDPQETIRNAYKMSELLGCPHKPTDNKTTFIKCLQQADPLDLLTSEPQGEFDNIYTFKPTIDGNLLKEPPYEALLKGKVKNTELLLGSTKEEGTMLLVGLLPFYFSFREGIHFSHSDLTYSVDRLVQEDEMVSKIIVHHYTDWANINSSEQNIASLGHVLGDFFFQCPLEDFAKSFSQAGRQVYKYYFTHRSSNSAWPKWAGTFHGEDILYIFGDPLHPHFNYTKDEIAFSRRVMRYWANFARTGNPNIQPSSKRYETLTPWPSYSSENLEYLVLAPNSTAVGRNFKMNKCAFWRNIFPKMRTKANEWKREKCG